MKPLMQNKITVETWPAFTYNDSSVFCLRKDLSMFRLILLLIIAALYLILTLPVLLVIWIIGKKNPGLRDRVARAMIRWIFKVILAAAGVKVTVIGEEKIPKDTAVLYTGNHRSIFDILITYVRTPRATGYVAKKELGGIPLFSLWARYINCLFFNRDDLKEGMKMILDGIAMLKDGKSVFIFPEGTRNKNDSDLPLLPFHEGSFKMASKSGCPIVPTALCNTINIWEGHFPWVRSAHVVLEYGDPIYVSELPPEHKKKVGAYVQGIMEEMMEKNQKLL